MLKPSKELFTYLFFLVLSGIFWVAASLNEYTEREVGVPVVITGVPKTVAFDSGVEDTVRVTVRDKGLAFLDYLYLYGIEPVSIDFNNYRRKNGVLYVSNAELRRLIRQKLEGTASISVVKPTELELAYDQCVSRTVPVRLSGRIIPTGSYYLAQTIINPSKVTIYLSKAMADSVKYVKTEDLNITNFTDTLSFEAKLKPIKGVNFSTQKVKVHLYTDILTEEELEIPITAINVPEGVSLRFFPSHVKVKYVVGVSMLKNIDPNEFVVQADYNKIGPDDNKCDIVVAQKPHGVVKASPETTQVDYLREY